MPYIGNPSAQRFTSPRAASVFSGDGSTVAFTLEEAVTTDEDILVSVDGVIQEPSVAYAVSSGTTLTFTAAPSSNSGNNIFVYYIARTFGSVSMPDGQNVNAATGSFSGTLGVTGVLTGTSLDISGDIDVDGTTNLDNTDIDGNLDVTGASDSVVTLIKPQGALPDNSDNAGLYVLHQGTAGTGLRVRTDNALTGSNFAHILVNNASASINAFQVSQYGSGTIAKFDKSGTTVMQIDSIGAMTKPLQPAFSVKLSGAQNNIAVGSAVTVTFDTEIFDQNADFASNTFTAPVTGRYQLNLVVNLGNVDSASSYYQLRLVTSNRTYYHTVDTDFGQDNSYFETVIAVLADMDANDTAIAQVFQASGTQQTDIDGSSAFSGFLAC